MRNRVLLILIMCIVPTLVFPREYVIPSNTLPRNLSDVYVGSSIQIGQYRSPKDLSFLKSESKKYKNLPVKQYCNTDGCRIYLEVTFSREDKNQLIILTQLKLDSNKSLNKKHHFVDIYEENRLSSSDNLNIDFHKDFYYLKIQVHALSNKIINQVKEENKLNIKLKYVHDVNSETPHKYYIEEKFYIEIEENFDDIDKIIKILKELGSKEITDVMVQQFDKNNKIISNKICKYQKI